MRTTRHILYFLASAILFAWALFLPTGCGGDGNAAPKVIKKDTTIALIAYMGYGLKSKHYGPARKITQDTLMRVYTDTARKETELKRITWYEAEVPIAVDSAWNKRFGDPILDSNGKQNVIIRILQLPPMYVRDSVTDFEADWKDLDKFLIKDSLIKKP